MDNFYVYYHSCVIDGIEVIFYVGKGKHRKYRKYCRGRDGRARSTFWKNFVAAHGPWKATVHLDHLTEQESLDAEIALIKAIGRRNTGAGTLVNLTDGGEGVSGRIQSTEERAMRSAAQRKRRTDPEDRARTAAASKKMWEDPAHRERVVSTQRARYQADPTLRIRQGEGVRNRTSEMLAKQGEAMRRRWEDPAYKARMAESMRRSREGRG